MENTASRQQWKFWRRLISLFGCTKATPEERETGTEGGKILETLQKSDTVQQDLWTLMMGDNHILAMKEAQEASVSQASPTEREVGVRTGSLDAFEDLAVLARSLPSTSASSRIKTRSSCSTCRTCHRESVVSTASSSWSNEPAVDKYKNSAFAMAMKTKYAGN
ncbi:hypothetical protein CAPTEDRAFT_185002 [Capitella teleta]|uniref:Uncharacterized protein n=1 Tax=Capitella teleta TaxID=283909 RepID=R7T5E5_CAPTE|nr:hypothetical protein CAPTEDRAFT_185002 [Capitella teleta]|eukprot:ELT88559.1 hypothetical protein CAPTEDRAFT_185002 [Capitella teleta]